MNEGVKILLERMKTNPEEFVPDLQFGASKWGNLIDRYRQFLSNEDNKAIDDAWKKTVHQAMQEKFTAAVMKELLAPDEEYIILGKPWYSNTANVTLGAGVTPVRSSVTINNTNAVGTWGTSSIQLAQAQQAVDLQTQQVPLQIERMKQMKHQTLFGKLKNYLHSDT